MTPDQIRVIEQITEAKTVLNNRIQEGLKIGVNAVPTVEEVRYSMTSKTSFVQVAFTLTT